jgi:hypothetical protein
MEKINSYRYSMFNLTPFFKELKTEKGTVLHTGKNHVHAANLSMAALAEVSVEPLIYCGL